MLNPQRVSGALVALLREEQVLGSFGPVPIEDHIRHALGFLAPVGILAPGSRLIDLGSGGGLPGLVLADALPDLRICLLEGRTQRAERLVEHVAALGFADRVTVSAARAEDAAHDPELRYQFDLSVARGFGPPAVTAECAAGFLRQGGRLIVSEPPTGTEARWSEAGCRQLGLRIERRLVEPFSYVVLCQEELADARYPRRVGVPAKRPLF